MRLGEILSLTCDNVNLGGATLWLLYNIRCMTLNASQLNIKLNAAQLNIINPGFRHPVKSDKIKNMNRKSVPLIRCAVASDASLLAELGASSFYDTFAVYNTPEDMAAYLSASFGPALQAQELADPDTKFLIAEIDGIAAGYAKLQLTPPPSCITGSGPVELSRLYVSSALIGSGVGAALMEACLCEASKAGYETMWLGVWERNERAQAFYNKWGFQAVGEHIFLLGSDAQKDWIMQREI
jgi:diamine N-acetyltransferase